MAETNQDSITENIKNLSIDTVSSQIDESYRKVGRYATLMETNAEEKESWYYFINYDKNKEELEYLKEQIDTVDFYLIDDLSTFDIDLEHLVDSTTAKQMSKIEVNSVMFHRKYDGKLQKINFKFKRNDDDEDRMYKCYEILGKGGIEDYVSDEDIDPEDKISEDESGDTYEETCEDSEESEESEENRVPRFKKRGGELPKSIKDLPRDALRKRRHKK